MLKFLFKNVYDVLFLMGFLLCCLVVGSIFGGFMVKDMMIGLGINFWGNVLFIFLINILFIELEYIL